MFDLNQIAENLIKPQEEQRKPESPEKDRLDNVPGLIEGEEIVGLSEGEFIIPADVVREIGKGSIDAGSQILQSMVNSIRRKIESAPATIASVP